MMNEKDMMTPGIVQLRLKEIYESRGDDERAHGMEDDLWRDVLKAIAEGRCFDHATCARKTLESLEIDFSRWYA